MKINDLPTDAAATLEAFAGAVRTSPHNLLSARGLQELEDRHVGESVGFARRLRVDGVRVLDLGTGGGFPGMVLAIVRPDLEVTLLDATAKKIAFLRDFAQDHEVDVRTAVGRAEDLAGELGGQFDAVTARAVAPLERLIPWAMPFLRDGGDLHAIKGERWREELVAAAPALRRARAKPVEVLDPVPTGSDPGTAPAPRVVIIRKQS